MARRPKYQPSPQAREARRIAVDVIAKFRDTVPVEGGCGDYTFPVVIELNQRGIRAFDILGSYWEDGVGIAGVHHWVGLPSSDEWIDPTSEQHGLPPVLVLGPHDALRERFQGIAIKHESTIDHVVADLEVAASVGVPVRLRLPVLCTTDLREMVERRLATAIEGTPS